MWKSGYFKDGVVYALGDVNHDRSIGISDVMLTVDYVLGNASPLFNVDQADVSGDGEITVADVTSIVSIALGSRPNLAPALNRPDNQQNPIDLGPVSK